MAIFLRYLLDREPRGEGEVPSCRDTASEHDFSHIVPKGCGQELLVVVAMVSFQKESGQSLVRAIAKIHRFVSSRPTD